MVEAGNGYAAKVNAQILGVEKENALRLPRQPAAKRNAKKVGPGGRPGCWAQSHARSVADAVPGDGQRCVSIAPYNHFDLGQPLMKEYVWGRQGRGRTRSTHENRQALLFRLAIASGGADDLRARLIIVVFGQIRFDRTSTYSAQFSNISGLRDGPVRNARREVEVGKVKKKTFGWSTAAARYRWISPFEKSLPAVSVDGRHKFGTRTLIGNRYLELKAWAAVRGADRVLQPGGLISLSPYPARPLDLDALIGGFKTAVQGAGPRQGEQGSRNR